MEDKRQAVPPQERVARAALTQDGYSAEVPIPGDSGWWVSGHYVRAADGRHVLAELRVFPGPDRDPGVPPSEVGIGRWKLTRDMRAWLAERSGITTGLLRQIALGPVSASAPMSGPDFDDLVEGLASFDNRRRPGRAGRDDLAYAALAYEYVRLVRGGSRRPNVQLAAARGWTAKQVRDQLEEATNRGLLPRLGKGRVRDSLTPKAEALLEQTQTAASAGKREDNP
jgi:hypothetical protein